MESDFFEVGTLVAERYLIEERLTRGGMMEVALAQDLAGSSLKRVVLKKVSSFLAEHPHAQAALSHEASILKRLDHPQMVKLESWHEIPKPLLVMSYIPGMPLDVLPCIKPSLFEKIESLLNDLHAQGIVHGDLKPGHILLNSNQSVNLIDFGLARDYHDPEAFDPSIFKSYTPRYASDSIKAGNPALPADDWYAFNQMKKIL